jgi:hypothetical protein
MVGLATYLNSAAAQVYDALLRKACLGLLDTGKLPVDQAQAGRDWLQKPNLTTYDIERFRERLLERLREVRDDNDLNAA